VQLPTPATAGGTDLFSTMRARLAAVESRVAELEDLKREAACLARAIKAYEHQALPRVRRRRAD